MVNTLFIIYLVIKYLELTDTFGKGNSLKGSEEMTNASEELIGLIGQFRIFMKNLNSEWSRKTMTGMNATQFKLLYTLHSSGSLKVSEIAELLGLTSGAVTGITDKLAADGLISRERASNDRRVVFIALTPSGEKLVDRVVETHQEIFSSFFHALPEEDIQHLRRIFSKLIANMEEGKLEKIILHGRID